MTQSAGDLEDLPPTKLSWPRQVKGTGLAIGNTAAEICLARAHLADRLTSMPVSDEHPFPRASLPSFHDRPLPDNQPGKLRQRNNSPKQAQDKPQATQMKPLP